MIQPCTGLSLARTPNGIPVARLHYSADPDLTPEILAKIRKQYSSDAYWRKEMEIEFDALSGALVYPEYDEKIHVVPDSEIPRRGSRFMSIDPHPRTPHAFLWVVIDKWSDWYVYRELWPSIVYGRKDRVSDDDQENSYTVRDYAETLAVLEGCRMEWRRAETDAEYGIIHTKDSRSEKVTFRLMDQAGKGFLASGDGQQEESYSKRYARYGIRCIDPRKSHHTGEDAIRQLLKPRKHDLKGTWSKLHIAESCLELRYEFGHHRYQKTKTMSEERDLKQDRSAARCHQLDNLRYLGTSNAAYSRWTEC